MIQIKSDGGPAFPPQDRILVTPQVDAESRKLIGDALTRDRHTGMSLRDYFAAQVMPMTWQMECDAPTGPWSEHMEPTYLGAAKRAYFFADAMLRAREEQP